MQNISNKALIKKSSFINGQWLKSERFFDVVNPATEQTIGSIGEVESYQVELAINSASNALDGWQSLSESVRAQRLHRWQFLIKENLADLARLLTLEQGKTLEEAKAEILHAANYVKLYSELAVGLHSASNIESVDGQNAKVYKRPIGVVAAITPWNFPCSMILRKAAGAIAAGCTVVLKPSELTPMSALALAQLSIEAEIPEGVFNVVVGSNSQAIGEILTKHPKVAKLSFTGSTAVGKKLLQQCAFGVKRTSMELGGNAPFIVFNDADIEQAIKGAIASKFRNSGQTCISANRFLLHCDIAESFKVRLLDEIKLLNIGNGLEPLSDIGPLISAEAVKKMTHLIKEDQQEGGKLLVGGSAFKRNGYFFEPTVLENIGPEMAIFNREIFGPVVSITTFENEKQAIILANQSELGLCGYIYTKNPETMKTLTAKLQLGMLGINEVRLSNPAAPFGGVKQSGMGREGGRYGLDEYLDCQYVCSAEIEQ